VDASRICHGLYQGAAPASSHAVTSAGFQVLVLAAVEVQPPEHALVGLDVLRCPLTDDPTRPLTEREWSAAVACAKAVRRRLVRGQSVLVTCAQGRNRSGLVSALTLIQSGWQPQEAIRHIKQHRDFALTNPRFVEALLSRRCG
jgi:protein-tyrosine phosphatase